MEVLVDRSRVPVVVFFILCFMFYKSFINISFWLNHSRDGALLGLVSSFHT